MSPKNIELVIFDCDGTLANTEYMHQLAVIGSLDECGFPGYTVEFCLEHFVGRGMPHVQKIIEEREGRPLPPFFLDHYLRLCNELMSKGVDSLPDAVPAVQVLSKDYKICVASNGETETVVKTVQAIGMMGYFGLDHIYTKAQVARGKPSPDLFLFAASQMGVDPSQCVVVEDSIAGVSAGLAAGMVTIGIIGVSHNPEQIRKDMKNVGVSHIIDSWPEITTFIQGL